MIEQLESCWAEVNGSGLHQGDYLLDLRVPLFADPFPPEAAAGATAEGETEIQTRDAIVVSQTCDLANDKLRFVALCPVLTIENWEHEQPGFAGKWKEVLKGRREGLHLLGSITEPKDARRALVVDFREILSLPMGYVERHAFEQGPRFRLKSPFVEHFSQAFGRFYMRVALPNFISL